MRISLISRLNVGDRAEAICTVGVWMQVGKLARLGLDPEQFVDMLMENGPAVAWEYLMDHSDRFGMGISPSGVVMEFWYDSDSAELVTSILQVAIDVMSVIASAPRHKSGHMDLVQTHAVASVWLSKQPAARVSVPFEHRTGSTGSDIAPERGNASHCLLHYNSRRA